MRSGLSLRSVALSSGTSSLVPCGPQCSLCSRNCELRTLGRTPPHGGFWVSWPRSTPGTPAWPPFRSFGADVPGSRGLSCKRSFEVQSELPPGPRPLLDDPSGYSALLSHIPTSRKPVVYPVGSSGSPHILAPPLLARRSPPTRMPSLFCLLNPAHWSEHHSACVLAFI